VVGLAQNLVSHHLRQLKVAGMVSSRRNGRLVMYRLTERGRMLTSAVMGVVVELPNRV
jgi:ArsR family transcriptional regulator, lead/cadmium/zinc/bismuth-responsive transcriptional repressor